MGEGTGEVGCTDYSWKIGMQPVIPSPTRLYGPTYRRIGEGMTGRCKVELCTPLPDKSPCIHVPRRSQTRMTLKLAEGALLNSSHYHGAQPRVAIKSRGPSSAERLPDGSGCAYKFETEGWNGTAGTVWLFLGSAGDCNSSDWKRAPDTQADWV